MSVLVIGDANVDIEIRLPSTDRAATHGNPEPRLFGGGSAANTAAALARLGVACGFAGSVGDDSFGRFAVADLEASGVDTSVVSITDDAPTVAVIAVVQSDGDRLIYVWPATGGAHSAFSPVDAVAAVSGSEWLHISGICLRVSPARQALLDAMEAARNSGIPVSFDLNLRLENWGWDDGFREVVAAAVERSDVVLGAAADEVGALTGIDDPVAAAVDLAGEDRLVVARLGPDGAVAGSTSNRFVSPGFSVAMVDSVGAGDAFNAGFIAARLRGSTIEDSLRWGNAVAALTITRPGARSTPTTEDVEEFLTRELGYERA
ncbi:MAG: sugar kinase [Acidimicrobiia bacterium]